MKRVLFCGLVAGAVACCPAPAVRDAGGGGVIDPRSHELGVITAFAEIVARDVKRLALASPMSAAEVDGLWAEAQKVAARYGVLLERDKDFLVTDLFAEADTVGKDIVLIFKPPVGDEYRALKAEKAVLVATGNWKGEPRREIARKFGRLLSYSDRAIDELLAKSPAP